MHNAPFHNEAARKIRSTPDLKAVFMWPRGHAKSTHMDIFVPLWLMFQPKRLINFMVVVGKSEDSAERLLGDIQAELEHNQRIIADFGKQRADGSWQEGEFKAANGVKFLACGRGQSPRGLRDREARPDYIVIDDLDDDELCRNEKRVHDLTDWVKEALFGALDVGRGRFIMVGNLISKTSVLFNISRTKGVFLSKVQAVDKDGGPVWKEKWTKEEATAYRDFVGYRAWEKEMMHNPIVDGTIFRADWIRYKKMPGLSRYEMLVCYTDPSFKSATSNDYKACRLWGKKGTELHLIDCFVRQATVGEMVRWMYDLYERTRDTAAIYFFMEANFMQDVILDEFAEEGNLRGYQLPIMPDKRKKPDKLQRIEAVSPLWERGFVFYNVAKRKTRTCRWASNRHWHWSTGAGRTTMPRTRTRARYGYCSATRGRKVFNRCSAKGRPPKIYGNHDSICQGHHFRLAVQACRQEGEQTVPAVRDEVSCNQPERGTEGRTQTDHPGTGGKTPFSERRDGSRH